MKGDFMKEDKKIVITIPLDEVKDSEKMARENEFNSVEDFVRSRYTIAMRTYYRKHREED